MDIDLLILIARANAISPLFMTKLMTCNKLKNVSKPRPSTDLVLKHEILSKECDLFRVFVRKNVLFNRILRTAIPVSLISWLTYNLRSVQDSFVLQVLLVLGIICAVFVFHLKSIEERILLIRGLGVQITNVNGFGQETSNFIPAQSIQSVYIFESFDGLRVRNFFNIKLKTQVEDKFIDNSKANIILFETLKPPVQFLKRIYHKIHESRIVDKFDGAALVIDK